MGSIYDFINLQYRVGPSAEPPLDRGTFKKGITYKLTLDMFPSFILQNTARTKYCIWSSDPQWAGFAQLFQDFLNRSGEEVRLDLRIAIDTPRESQTEFEGTTQAAYNLKTFYESALAEGAQECVPGKGRYI
jgi:hypothetical protein